MKNWHLPKFLLPVLVVVLATACGNNSSTLLAQGTSEFESENYQGAIDSYQQVLEHGSATSGEILVATKGLAESSYLLGNYPAAYGYYSAALASEPSVSVYNNRGLTLHELERYEEAVTDFTRALALTGSNTQGTFPIFFNRAGSLDALERYEEAKQDLDVAIMMNSNLGNAYYLRSLVHADLGLLEESEADRLRAEELGFTP